MTGVRGLDGLVGLTGLTGETGLTGVRGLDGLIGLTGLTGQAGIPGLPGPSGVPGLDGLTGLTGLTGGPGLTGLTGLAGLAGLIGAPGDSGSAAVPPVADSTTLCVTNTASRREVRRGGLVRWTLAVKNCGARPAFGVAVADRPLKGATVKNRGSAVLAGGRLGWKTGTLAPGARKTYTFTTRIRPNARTGLYINRAVADGDNTQPATGHGSTVVTSGRK